MLTKVDLNKIQKIVQKEVRNEVRNEVGDQLVSIKKDLKTIKSDVSKIRQDVDTIISVFDREYVDLRKRVEKIENHLGLSSTQ